MSRFASAVLAIVVVVSTAALGYWWRVVPGKYQRFENAVLGGGAGEGNPRFATKEMTLVELDLQSRPSRRLSPFFGRTLLSIPKAYLDYKHWEGQISGLQDIWIESSLPDNRPLSIVGEEIFIKLRAETKDLLEADFYDFKDQYQRLVRNRSLSIAVSYSHCFSWVTGWKEQFARNTPRDYAFDHPVFYKHRTIGLAGSFADVYVPKVQRRIPTFIACEPPERNGRCKAESAVDGIVSFEYLFAASRLNEYQEIEDKARALVKSFITSNKATQALPEGCWVDAVP